MQTELQRKLSTTIARGEAIFLSKVAGLDRLRKIVNNGKTVEVTQESLTQWMSKIVHDTNGRHRKLNRHATAYYRKQVIRYNPLWLESISPESWDKRILDLVLHEMGHLFCYHFLGTVGHEWTWCEVGRIVGYAEVGSSSDDRRMRYTSFAAHADSVATVESKPISKIAVGTVSATVLPQSTIRSPVATVWAICENMRGYTRKEIIYHCLQVGINPNTAATQYAAWKRARG